MKTDDIVGKKVGIYDVISVSNIRTSDGHKLYHVLCSVCGWHGKIRKQNIKRAKKCTHISIDSEYKRYDTVWENKRIRSIFRGMKDRCYNPNCKSYMWYGGKGIKIYDKWMKEPHLFEEWSIENKYDNTLTIDRINENEDYCPKNCRWVPAVDNAKYKSTTNIITVNGVSHTGREWGNECGLGCNTINQMLRMLPKEKVIEFIRRRLDDKNKQRKPRQTWLDTYGIK